MIGSTMAQDVLRWGSAGPGTGANVTVEAMVRIVEKYENTLKISPQATAGSTENVRLLASGDLDMGIAQGNVAWKAFNGDKPFNKAVPLLALFSPYVNHQFLITRKGTGIKTLYDLEGKRVSIGPPGSGGARTCKKIFDVLGIKVNSSYLGYADGGRALSDGRVDATLGLGIGGQPSDALLELDNMLNDLVFIPFTEEEYQKVKATDYTTGRRKIDKKYLRNLKEDLYTHSLDLVHYATPRMDETTAYKIVKTIFDHYQELGKYHALGKLITPETALDYFGGIPMHPGAAKYFKEKGLWRDDLKIGSLN